MLKSTTKPLNAIQRMVDNIDEAERVLARVQHTYLESAGWTRNCAAPGSIWLWAKEVDGVTYAVPIDVALSMQRHLDFF